MIPDVGTMLPQGRVALSTGVPRCLLHTTAPVAASSAYTVSFSVAVMTRAPIASGSA